MQTSHNGGVQIRDIALECRRAVHHWHTGKADIILKRNTAAQQRTARGAFDLGLYVPRIHRVFFDSRAMPRGAGIKHWGQIIGQPVDNVIGIQRALHHVQELLHTGI